MDERMYYSVAEAAEQMRCCARTVRNAIKAGSLQACRPDGCRGYLITPEAIRAYVEPKPTVRAVGQKDSEQKPKWQPEIIA